MKKKMMVVGLGLMVAGASANESVKLQEGDYALNKIDRMEVTEVVTYFPQCPPNALCEPASKITLEIPLNGCLDRLGPVSTRLQYNELTGKHDLFVSAINIHNEKSNAAYCFAMPKEYKTIYTRPFLEKEEINLVILR